MKRTSTGAKKMKVAFSVWDGRIAPVFDVAKRICLVEFEGNSILRETHEDLSTSSPASNAAWLAEQEVETLVCGAISCPVRSMVAAYGIQILPFVTGEFREIVCAWLDGSLKQSGFAMPGCQKARRRMGGCHRKAREGNDRGVVDDASGQGTDPTRGDGTGSMSATQGMRKR